MKTSKKSKKALNERTKENKNLIFLLEELRGNDETRQREQANVDKDSSAIIEIVRRIMIYLYESARNYFKRNVMFKMNVDLTF